MQRTQTLVKRKDGLKDRKGVKRKTIEEKEQEIG
jgi:hypothetical protein